MAISIARLCEIRALVMHVYPDGIKAYGRERHIVYLRRRGKPVCKLWGRRGTTVSVTEAGASADLAFPVAVCSAIE